MAKTSETKGKARSKNHGTLEKKPSGAFLARWTANGKRYSQLLKDAEGKPVTNRREAEKLLEGITAPFRLESKEATAEYLAVKAGGVKKELEAYRDRQPALTLGDAFDAYRRSTVRPRRAGDGALDGYESFFNSLIGWLAKNRPDYADPMTTDPKEYEKTVELRAVTEADADAFTESFLQTHSAGTFNKHLIFYRCLWKTLALGDKRKSDTPTPGEYPKAKLLCNPWESIQKQTHEPHRHRELTAEELIRVCGSVEGELRILFAIGIYTGMRLGDCCLLDWGAVDLVRGILTKKPHKTVKHGTIVRIPLHKALASMLSETPTDKRTGYIIPQTAEKYTRDPGAVSKKVQATFEANGIETTVDSERKGGKARVEVGFHSLRHTFVSLCGNAGVSLSLVQSMVGHTSKEMTQYYFHENDTALRNAVNLLPDVVEVEAIETDNKQTRLDALRKALEEMRTAGDDLDDAQKIVREVFGKVE